MKRGFTLVELMLTVVIASLMFTAAYYLLTVANQVYKRVAGHEDVALQVKKASRILQQELLVGNFNEILVEKGPISLAGAADGDAICLLSARERGLGPTARKPAGQPFWQRNVIFYLVTPVGDPCTGVADGDGYEDACPHKILIRKILDRDGPTDPPWVTGGNNDPVNDLEELASGIIPFLTRPNGLNPGPINPPVESVDVVATNLLSMRVQLAPVADHPGEVLITFKAFNAQASNKTTAIGSVALSDHDNSLEHVLSVFPRNNQ